jgi:hypothetical protein
MNSIDLIGVTDAEVWATKWLEVITENPSIPTDKGTMIGWFANAIMAGYDQGVRAEQRRNILEKLRELIYMAAGAATAPVMIDHPDYVFPSERVQEAVEQICENFGIPKTEEY